MSATVRLWGFLAAVASVVALAALLVIGADIGGLVTGIGLVAGLVSVGMAVARPYVFGSPSAVAKALPTTKEIPMPDRVVNLPHKTCPGCGTRIHPDIDACSAKCREAATKR